MCTLSLIYDAAQIIEHTLLSIVHGCKSNKGYHYIKEFDISFQGVNAKHTILEIYNQCIKNNIKLFIQIRLINNEIITIKT